MRQILRQMKINEGQEITRITITLSDLEMLSFLASTGNEDAKQEILMRASQLREVRKKDFSDNEIALLELQIQVQQGVVV